MKFAHLADCHLGGWREEKLTKLNSKAFVQAMQKCKEKQVDFILIAGDLFNTALPSIDVVRLVVKEFRKLKKANIPVYLIAGSHDFSPSGKTMLEVLEEAGLCKNVVKGDIVEGKLKLNFTIDEKTGAKLTGLLGRRGVLEKTYYEELVRDHLEDEEGFKIFLFHTALTELKPEKQKHMFSAPVSLLPKGFDYYAGGHVHIVKEAQLDGYKHVVYPGPLFPNSFSEIEELQGSGFYVYDEGSIERVPLDVIPITSFAVDATHKSVEEVEKEVFEKTINEGALVTLRLKGKLSTGKPSDLHHKQLLQHFYDQNAYAVLKSTSGLETQEFETIQVEESSVEEVEEALMKEHAGQHKGLGKSVDDELSFTKELMHILSEEQNEAEKKYEYEERVLTSMKKVCED